MVSPESQVWIDNLEFGNFGVKTTANKKSSSLGICPNPAINQVRVKVSGVEKTNLFLMNAEGRIVRNFPGTFDGQVLSLGGLSAGIYLLASPETGITQKFIIQP
ncbi:MAG: T9SS type A sorting domain-containing protein [Bacteroidetes bacterium]|nr:T9SS type A sorting domain-containing protein [Bacteroidota bacterium]